jgi:hypothetical protein
MNRLARVKPQYQGAGVRLVIRVISNDLTAFYEPRDTIRIDSTLEHPLKRVPGKVQFFAVHGLYLR